MILERNNGKVNGVVFIYEGGYCIIARWGFERNGKWGEWSCGERHWFKEKNREKMIQKFKRADYVEV